jgi:hypothetical protein
MKTIFQIILLVVLSLNCRAAIVPILRNVFTTNTFNTGIVGGAIPYFDFPSGKFVGSPTAYSNAILYDPTLGFLSIVHTNDTGDLLLQLAVAGPSSPSIQGYADKFVVANTNLTLDAVGPFSIRLRINGSNVLETVASGVSLNGFTNLITDTGSALAYNGVPIGGGSALWSSAGGVLYPFPAVDVVRIESQLADNSTNVALVVDTSVPWETGGKLISASSFGVEGMALSVNAYPGNHGTLLNLGNHPDGDPPFNTAELSANTNSMIFYIGDNNGAYSHLTNCLEITAIGDANLQFVTITDGFDMYNYGFGNGQAYATNAEYVFNYGINNGTGGTIFDGVSWAYNYGTSCGIFGAYTNCTHIFNYGTGAGANQTLTNSSHIYAFGNNAGRSLSGSWTDLMLFGDHALPSQNHQTVFNVGAVSSGKIYQFQNGLTNEVTIDFQGSLTLSGKTNLVGDNGSALTYNGTPILQSLYYGGQYGFGAVGFVPTNIHSSNLPAGTNDIFTVPVGKKFISGGMQCSTTNTTSTTVTEYLKTNGVYYPYGPTSAVTTNNQAALGISGDNFIFEAGESISISTTQTGINAVHYGFLLSTNINIYSPKLLLFTSLTNTVYTCPVGKVAINMPFPNPISGSESVFASYLNASGASRTNSFWIVPSGGVPDNSNILFKNKIVANNGSSSITCGILFPGDSIVISSDSTNQIQWVKLTVAEIPFP